MSQLSTYFPISDPILIFLVILLVILLVPIIMGKLRIPHIIGVALTGMLLGEHELGILDRDNSFELFGNVGLYHIMFLAALEVGMGGAKKNKYRMLTFGLLTFAIPLALVYVSSIPILRYSVMSSPPLRYIMASDTLMAYPIASHYGSQRKPSVTLSVGSTMLSLLLALTLLAGIVASYQNDANLTFQLFFALKSAVYCVAMIMLIPRLTRQFLRSCGSTVMQYIFVMLMIFISTALSAAVGFGGIFGVFLAGLILNRYIPTVSLLMNRIEFIGNALFVLYFLIGVGMLINPCGLFNGSNISLILFVIMVMGTLGKLLAVYISYIGFRPPLSSGTMMFGLISAHAADAIAMVMAGMKIETAPDVYLVDDDLLNGVVLMILSTCVISSLVTEHPAQKITLRNQDVAHVETANENNEHMLISVKYLEYVDHLVNLALLVRSKKLNRPLTALNVMYEDENVHANQEKDRRLLEQVSRCAAGSDVAVQAQVCIAVSIVSGTKHAFQEFRTSEIIIGMHAHTEVSKKFWEQFHQSLANGLNCQIVMTRLMQPLNTLQRIVVAVPSRAQFEPGFYRWLERLSRMTDQLEYRIQFHSRDDTPALIRQFVQNRHRQVRAEFVEMTHWNEVPKLAATIAADHMLVVVAARRGTVSYKNALKNLAKEIRQCLSGKTLLIIFPDQYGSQGEDMTFSQSQYTGEHSAYEVLGGWIRNALGRRK